MKTDRDEVREEEERTERGKSRAVLRLQSNDRKAIL